MRKVAQVLGFGLSIVSGVLPIALGMQPAIAQAGCEVWNPRRTPSQVANYTVVAEYPAYQSYDGSVVPVGTVVSGLGYDLWCNYTDYVATDWGPIPAWALNLDG